MELVDSLDECRTSSSIRGVSMPNFENLDARIASALNKIILNFRPKKKGHSGGTQSQKRGPFLRGRQTDLFDPRVLPGHWSQ